MGLGVLLRGFCIAVAAVAVALSSGTPKALAGYGVQPSDGLTVADLNPTFLVYVGDGETVPEVQVATAPAHDDFGFSSGYNGSCTPTTPFGEAHKFSCQLGSPWAPLKPGVYYWAYTYETQSCETLYGLPFCSTKYNFSGPFEFTVAQPTAPANASLVQPADGATVGSSPGLVVHAPANSTLEVYASSSSERLSNGTPAGVTAFSCNGSVSTEDDYTCDPSSPYDVMSGEIYYWWAIITVNGSRWIYGPRAFTVRAATSTGSSNSSSGGASIQTHQVTDAASLPRSAHFKGRSIKQTRLSAASYALTKMAGRPKTLAVACWNSADWPGVSGDPGDGYYALYGFYSPLMPHWVHLSPSTCRAMEKLLYNRPRYPNRTLAFALDTVTHEMIHALGIRNEAQTECYAMQVSVVMALQLKIPRLYAIRLAHLNLLNYLAHPAKYIDLNRCREGGAWDLEPYKPSLPWHSTLS